MVLNAEIFPNVPEYVNHLNDIIKLCSYIKCRKQRAGTKNPHNFKTSHLNKIKMVSFLVFFTKTMDNGLSTVDSVSFPFHFIAVLELDH